MDDDSSGYAATRSSVGSGPSGRWLIEQAVASRTICGPLTVVVRSDNGSMVVPNEKSSHRKWIAPHGGPVSALHSGAMANPTLAIVVE